MKHVPATFSRAGPPAQRRSPERITAIPRDAHGSLGATGSGFSAASHPGTLMPAPVIGGAPGPARSPGNPRARHLTREHVPLADVLAGQVTCSRPGPSRNRAEPEQEDQDRVRNDAGLDAAGTGPVHAEPDVDVREDESMEVDRARTPGPACAMRAQRDTVHPTSRRASPARRNPPERNPRDPTWRNASPGDITKTTPRGPAPDSPQGRGAQRTGDGWGTPGPRPLGRLGLVRVMGRTVRSVLCGQGRAGVDPGRGGRPPPRSRPAGPARGRSRRGERG